MRLPPQIRVVLGPSRLAVWIVVAMALFTAALVAFLPVPVWARAAVVVALATWAWNRLGTLAWRNRPGSVREIALTLDRVVVVRTGDGRLAAGVVRDASYVSPSVTTLVWKPDDARFARSILVLPDMLPAEDFRRLRTYLRYGRREVVAGEPASHA